MRKYIRMFKFYFLWRIALKVGERLMKKDPMYFPHFMSLTFSRDRIRQYYLANYTIGESILELFKEQKRAVERKGYKKRKREEAFMAMNDEEYSIYTARLQRQEEWNGFKDARAQFMNEN